MYSLSKISRDRLKGVHPNLIAFLEELIEISPHDFSIVQGVRTAEYQNSLYQRGRTILWEKVNGKRKKVHKVTNADGYKYRSNHQIKVDGYGYAADIGVLKKEKGKIVYKGSAKDAHYYVDIYNVAKENGLLEKYGVEWGGNCFKQMIDNPHWQIKNARLVAFK